VKVEDELAREFLESVLRGMKAGLFAVDKEARIRIFTSRAEKLTGFKQGEVLERTCFDVLRTKRCEEGCSVRQTQHIPEKTLNYETIATTKSGAELPVDVTVTPLRADNGETLGAVGIIRDMTEQKRLWDTLRQERDRARQYLSVARVTIVALDARGDITLVNRRGCEILGYEEEELVGQDWFDVCLPDSTREDARRTFRRLVAGAKDGINCQELPVVTKGGAERTIAWHHVALRNDDGEIVGLLCSGEDITERIQAQAELIRSEKLAAIGQLAAGVAHEVNNPLAGILVYIKLLLKKFQDNRLQTAETETQLLKVKTELERSSRIIKDLLDFSRQSQPTLRPVDVNEVLEATLAIVGHQISLGNITLEKGLGAGLPQVVADFDQIQQALMNVILNAAQAMPDGGTLTIRTSRAQSVKLNGFRRDAVRIDISDTGVGIAEENLDKVFTPFFSTKVKGKGVGLGLAAVQGIIERHKGKIVVKSKLNAGTTITIWLGAVNEESGENPDRR
jgi:PAS domain S-box-containing protein